MPDATSDVWVAPGVTAFVAPPGTPMNDSAAWKQIGGPPGASFVNGRIIYDEATRDYLAANFCIPQTFIIGADNPATFNKRSKPMTLTKDHKYTDNDGDTIEVRPTRKIDPDDVTAIIDTLDGGSYVHAADSIPLALNVLGYDRTGIDDGTCAKVGTYFATGHPIRSSQDRDELLAKAIANLKSIDLYDQRADERKAAEERATKLTADLDAAGKKLRNLSANVADYGVTAVRAGELAEAVAKYKAAFDAHAGV